MGGSSNGAVPEAEDLAHLHFVPFPPVEQLAVVGDRRTAATVAADGTVSFMCLPRYDADPVFGCLLDLKKGGYWRLGPEDREFGVQTYVPGTAVLRTRWEGEGGSVLEATDFMMGPEDARPPGSEGRRTLLRRLRCVSGQRAATMRVVPREDYSHPAVVHPAGATAMRVQTPAHDMVLWCSHPLAALPERTGARLSLVLHEGEEVWAVLDTGEGATADWTTAKAAAALEGVTGFWRAWSGRLDCRGGRAEEIRRSAVVAYLLSYAPTGAVIAAATTSLPERVPGKYNYDYRFCWVRDGSLTLSLLAELGAKEPVGRFLDWMAGCLKPDTGDASAMPLQVAYRIDGGEVIPATERPDLSGYRGALPVRFGNPVYQMEEIDSFGYLADCALIHAQHGGTLTDAHWTMLRRCAAFVVHNWTKPSAGIWELMPMQQFVVTKVMSWVTLDRVVQVAALLGRDADPAWATVRDTVHAEVMEKGWNGRVQSFVQRYGSEAMDAAVLLIPLMRFLPPDHPRVRATVERVAAVLRVNGLVHRFVPDDTPGRPDEPVADREGAFLMCSFWLAQAWWMMGETERAEAVLRRAEKARGTSGLFSEAADSRQVPGLLGNTPLLFSQVEYARAARVVGKPGLYPADGHRPGEQHRRGAEGGDAQEGGAEGP